MHPICIFHILCYLCIWECIIRQLLPHFLEGLVENEVQCFKSAFLLCLVSPQALVALPPSLFENIPCRKLTETRKSSRWHAICCHLLSWNLQSINAALLVSDCVRQHPSNIQEFTQSSISYCRIWQIFRVVIGLLVPATKGWSGPTLPSVFMMSIFITST